MTALEARRQELGVDADHTFAARTAQDDDLGGTYVRFHQHYRGIRVLGGGGTIQLDPDGRERKLTDALVRGISIDVTPRLSALDARRAVEAAIQPGAYVAEPRIELAVLPERTRVKRGPVAGQALRENAADFERVVTGGKLVYRVETAERRPVRELVTLVDAQTGEILKSTDSAIHTQNLARTHYSGNQQIDVTSFGGNPPFTLVDPVRGSSEVWDEEVDSDPMFDLDGNWGDGQSYMPGLTARQTAGADCYFGMEVTWDMFKRTLGWVGIDDNSAGIGIGVHDSSMFNNAKFSSWSGNLYFGDSNRPGGTMCAMDVVGHEYGHAVMYETADVGHGVGESGGLNEANSDIWGILARIYFLKGGFASNASTLPSTTFNEADDFWQLGIDIGGMRSLFNPAIKYWTSSLDNTEEHSAAGPMDRAFYFLSHGSRPDVTSRTWSHSLPWGMTGLGNDTAATIWMRTVTHHLQSGDMYLDARGRTIDAVRDVFTMHGEEEKAVRNAFAGIDVGDPAVNAPAPPQQISEVEPNDSIAQAQSINFPSTTPVPGLRKIDVVGAGNNKDDFQITIPCGKTFAARLESMFADFDLAVFQAGNSTALDSSTNSGDADEVISLPSNAGCTGSTTFFVRVQSGSQLPGFYILHMDRRD